MIGLSMKILFLGFIVTLASLTASTWQPVFAPESESQPTRFSLRTLAPYNSYRIGYEALPVRVIGGGGGKLGPREKFRLHVSIVENYTPRKVVAVRFGFFIFKFSDWDELVELRQTDLMPLELDGFERKQAYLVVGYVDDIPLLVYKPGAEFHMEIGDRKSVV